MSVYVCVYIYIYKKSIMIVFNIFFLKILFFYLRGCSWFYLRVWYRFNLLLNSSLTLEWTILRFSRNSFYYFIRYIFFIFIPIFRTTSIFGFALLINIVVQFFSGFLLSLYYIPDPSFVIIFRDEYIREIWWYFFIYKLHVIGVDTLFFFSYLHILKKIFIKNFLETDLDGWFTGMYAFLIFHLVVFLGITLSTNHLGEITITIVSNIYWSLLFQWHKTYTIFFSNKHLNVDQLTRFMVAHYLISYYYIYLLQLHIMYIHESWDVDSAQSIQYDSLLPKFSWLWDALKKELVIMFLFYLILTTWFIILAYPDIYVVNYSFFEQWSEVEVEDLNFFVVAPHWYFRAHMGLLVVCAQHYEGLFWLGSFYFLLSFLPMLYRWFNNDKFGFIRIDCVPMRYSFLQQVFFIIFIGSILYCNSVLPCGRFYYEAVEGFFGNIFLKLSYQYIFLYLSVLIHIIDLLEKSFLSFPYYYNYN